MSIKANKQRNVTPFDAIEEHVWSNNKVSVRCVWGNNSADARIRCFSKNLLAKVACTSTLDTVQLLVYSFTNRHVVVDGEDNKNKKCAYSSAPSNVTSIVAYWSMSPRVKLADTISCFD